MYNTKLWRNFCYPKNGRHNLEDKPAGTLFPFCHGEAGFAQNGKRRSHKDALKHTFPLKNMPRVISAKKTHTHTRCQAQKTRSGKRTTVCFISELVIQSNLMAVSRHLHASHNYAADYSFVECTAVFPLARLENHLYNHHISCYRIQKMK